MKKKKGGWWKVLLGTLLAIAVIFFGTVVFIMHAIAPSAGSISLNQLINTPKEYAGKEFNLLVVLARSAAGSDGAVPTLQIATDGLRPFAVTTAAP